VQLEQVAQRQVGQRLGGRTSESRTSRPSKRIVTPSSSHAVPMHRAARSAISVGAHVEDDQESRIEIVLVVEEGVREMPSGDELGVPSSAITATSR
jgi:hypothetical protein